MTDLDRDIVEHRRAMKFKLALVGLLLGVAAGLVGVVLAPSDASLTEGPMAFLIGLGFGVAVACGIAAVLFRPTEATRRAASSGGYRDRVQRERTSMIMVLPASTLGLTVIAMARAQEWLSGEDRSWGGVALACVAVLNIVLLPVMVMGWDGGARKMKRFLDDELSRAYRASAMTCAFWMLLVGVTGAYLVGLWNPREAVIALPMILWVASATAALRFAQLHRRAERGMGDDG